MWADAGNADGSVGGAELTMKEFADAAPGHIKLVKDFGSADAAIIGNCVQLPVESLDVLSKVAKVIRYHHDLARHESPEVRDWLDEHAVHVFTSPLHQALYGREQDDPNIPPALDLGRYRNGRNGSRSGAVALAPWQNLGKGQFLVAEWARNNEPVDVYGPGPFPPFGKRLNVLGGIPASDVAGVLRRYETFVHLPTAPEPFGRTVVEAWASGCRVITNRNVGALFYLEHDQATLERAGQLFWELVLS